MELKKHNSLVLAYAAALTSVVSALILVELLRLLGNPGFSPLFIAAVLFSAWYGGLGPGLMSTATASVAAYLLIPHADPAGSALRVSVFVLVGVLASLLGAAIRREALYARRAQSSAEQASAAKSRLLAMVSHELRAPLDPVVLVSEMLKRDPYVPPRIRQDLQMIRRNVDLEVRLIDDLVDLSRVGSGKLCLHRERIDLHEPLSDALNVCESEATEKNLSVKTDLQAKSSLVLADPIRLEQVFWNLIRNAVKFTPAGGSIWLRSRDSKDGVIVEISDTGIGIEPDRLSEIFKAFEQGSPDIADRFGGLGLGLAISQTLVEAHGGRISAASGGKGRGATFTISLLVAPAPAPTPDSKNGKTAAQPGAFHV